ncbi:hypothetical protein OAY88_01545 [Alphaproteobacteria bacterium]|nr:hypothetical protein [Alphaproteobacteria bacterium]
MRALAAIIHIYIISLPDGVGDASSFQQIAEGLAQLTLKEALDRFPGYGGGFGYAWLMGLIYLIFDQSPLLIQSFNVIAGTASVYLAYRLTKLCWDDRDAIKAAWAVALFPTLIMYSALTLREAFIVLFCLYAMLNILRWNQSGAFACMFLSLLGFVLAGFFHGGMFVGALMFSAFVILKTLHHLFYTLQKGRINLSVVLLFILGMAFILPYVQSNFDVPYIGRVSNAIDFERFIAHANNTQLGVAAYPNWMRAQETLEYVMLMPARFIYFIGAPFPWDIRSLDHIIGFFDGLFYLTLGWLIKRNFSLIWTNSNARLLLLVLIPLLVIYAVGTNNFGTGIRHRAKFVAVLIVIASPFIPRLKMNKKFH